MRQLLILGFYCEVYRKNPLCRVFLNNVLVDEFDIPHTPCENRWTLNLFLDPALWSREQFQLQSNTPFLKFLEFDDAGVRSLDIRIEIQNDDNNHANGFMTRHTGVILCQCYLASAKLWEDFSHVGDRWKYTKGNWHSSNRSVAQYYTGWRNSVISNLMMFADMHFPDIKQVRRSTDQQKLHCSNYQYLPQQYRYFPSTYRIGTSGYFHLTLVKKLGFWRHSTDRRRGYWKISTIRNAKDLYNKYKSYEDTGNINQ